MIYTSNPWGPTTDTLLVGDTTFNGMGAYPSMPAPAVAPTSTDGGFSLGSAGMGLQVLGAITGTIGSFYSAKSQQSSLRFQARMAEINARIAETGAQSVLAAGQNEVMRQTLRAGQLKSSQRVAMAANGVDLSVGNAAEVAASTDIMKEIDKNTIEANAVRSAWGYRTQAAGLTNEAVMRRGTADAISPFGAGLSTLLTSAGTVGSSWYRSRRDAALAARLGTSLE